jgi:hypothetical protein
MSKNVSLATLHVASMGDSTMGAAKLIGSHYRYFLRTKTARCYFSDSVVPGTVLMRPDILILNMHAKIPGRGRHKIVPGMGNGLWSQLLLR